MIVAIMGYNLMINGILDRGSRILEGVADGVEGFLGLDSDPAHRRHIVPGVMGEHGPALTRGRIQPGGYDRAAAAPGLHQAGRLKGGVRPGHSARREPQVAGELAHRGQPRTGGEHTGLDQVGDLLPHLLVRWRSRTRRDRYSLSRGVPHTHRSTVDCRPLPLAELP